MPPIAYNAAFSKRPVCSNDTPLMGHHDTRSTRIGIGIGRCVHSYRIVPVRARIVRSLDITVMQSDFHLCPVVMTAFINFVVNVNCIDFLFVNIAREIYVVATR